MSGAAAEPLRTNTLRVGAEEVGFEPSDGVGSNLTRDSSGMGVRVEPTTFGFRKTSCVAIRPRDHVRSASCAGSCSKGVTSGVLGRATACNTLDRAGNSAR
jgi:hypothetical protein